MKDHLIRGISEDGFIKICAVQARDTVERMREIHMTLPLATAALGRSLMACSMMGDELKNEEGSVTLQIRGGGPLGAICAVADSRGNVRGYLQNPAALLPNRADGKLDVGGGVGTDGVLTVIKDAGGREPFTGKVELVSGEIAEDVAAYYAISEQIATLCALGVRVDTDQSVKCAGGYIVQLLPGAPEELAERLERQAMACRSVTEQLESGSDIEAVIAALMGDMEYRILESHEIAYECKCSRERVTNALVSLGREELEKLCEAGETVTVTCQFCDKIYSFTEEDIRALQKK